MVVYQHMMERSKKVLGLNSVIQLNNVQFLEKEDRNIAVAADFGTWITCSKETVNFLKLFEREKTFEETLKITGKTNEELENSLKKYFDKGFLKVNNVSKFKSFDVNSMVLNANMAPELCILHVSNICNLSCKYCYAHTDENDKKSMSLDVILKGVERFMELPSNHLTIEFHGGEPLLQYPKIVKACEYATELAKKNNKTLSFAMQSNMTYMNDEIIEMLKKYNLEFGK